MLRRIIENVVNAWGREAAEAMAKSGAEGPFELYFCVTVDEVPLSAILTLAADHRKAIERYDHAI